MPVFNDLNLKNWKEFDIWTDSLWNIPERDKTGNTQIFITEISFRRYPINLFVDLRKRMKQF